MDLRDIEGRQGRIQERQGQCRQRQRGRPHRSCQTLIFNLAIELASLSGRLRRELKSRAKTRSPDVRVGKKGITDNVLGEVRRVFESDDLVKIALSQDRETRVQLIAELEDKLTAVGIATVGKTATLYKPLPKRHR